MKTVSENVSGNILVSENSTYHQLSAAEVTVKENVVARLFGSISKKLTVAKDAIVYLHGECNGEIINNGGVIYRFLPTGLVKVLESNPSKTK